MAENFRIDSLDKRILRSLQRNGRIQNVDLAKEVGLSPSPCLRRVRLLEEVGVIDRYVALLNPEKVNQNMVVFAQVWLSDQAIETTERFVYEIKLLPQIVECYIMAGECDFMLKIRIESLDEYRRFQNAHLYRIKGVQNIKTEIPLQIIKQTTELPL
jgi:Lrp/AsnC family leucine-responsive transcriptional regulator